MDGKVAQYYVDKAAYVAFREDFRLRCKQPEADPIMGWNLSELSDTRLHWTAIAKAVLESL